MKSATFKSLVSKDPKLLKMHFIIVPKKIIDKYELKIGMRLLCSINKNEAFQCGMVALGNGDSYISVNAQRVKAYSIEFGDIVNVELTEDKSKYGMEMPKELEELLKQDKEGKRKFDLLTPGKQRYIIYYVNGVKHQQKRIDRAVLLITNLKKLPDGKIDFKFMLNKNS